ncbi:VOC family protein [Allopontixanthobacter sediminis]|uniref:Methylmalonyl-CoA epimerase n=1 Tax=Allopontixanthobacter sediminis TaxID=1689985 RepID=A0A845B8A0_9SPHN|nr:VOC family protein [Allopontixanthobacter sediminis]MXP43839.1 methylmalonyl-CoA epimerase [Allopontixanthobacter sediminis]
MKLGRLNHIGVATPSMDESLKFYREVMGATSVVEPFELADRNLLVAFVDTPTESGMNGTQIELIQPLPGDTAFTNFLAKNPQGGQHHLCYEMADIHAAREWFEGQGKRILGPTRPGAHGTPIFFLHPKDMMGQLTEIMETPKSGH